MQNSGGKNERATELTGPSRHAADADFRMTAGCRRRPASSIYDPLSIAIALTERIRPVKAALPSEHVVEN